MTLCSRCSLPFTMQDPGADETRAPVHMSCLQIALGLDVHQAWKIRNRQEDEFQRWRRGEITAS